jgi:hypothetical protein
MSKSMSATTTSSWNTTFSGNKSLWQTTGPPPGSAHSGDQSPATGENDATASW